MGGRGSTVRKVSQEPREEPSWLRWDLVWEDCQKVAQGKRHERTLHAKRILMCWESLIKTKRIPNSKGKDWKKRRRAVRIKVSAR